MLRDIEIFCAIVKAQSLSQAARDLHISPSIVTRRLAKLEKQLNARLFQRTTRRVTLTETGQQYYDSVQDILYALTAANAHIKNLGPAITGTLKIGMPVSISHRYLSLNLHRFLQQYPDIHVQIVNGNHLLNLLDDGFDLIIHCGPIPDTSFHYKKISAWRKVICASPTYLATQGTLKTPNDLQRHNCLDHMDNFHYTWDFQEKGKVKTVAVKGNVRINSSIDLCHLAACGTGVVYLPDFSVQAELTSGQLIAVLEQYQLPELDMFAVYPSKHYLNTKTRVFIDFIAELFARQDRLDSTGI